MRVRYRVRIRVLCIPTRIIDTSSTHIPTVGHINQYRGEHTLHNNRPAITIKKYPSTSHLPCKRARAAITKY